MPVAAIDTELVVQVLKPIWLDKTETASRVRGRIELILASATTLRYRQGENPARWRGHLEHLLPKKAKIAEVAHLAALPYAKVPEFFNALGEHDSIAALGLRFVILTAARSNEVLGARWHEIDLDAKTWSVPANRMKGGREHQVPLSDAAVEILETVKPLAATKDAPVFLGHSGPASQLSDTTLRALIGRTPFGKFTVHGFRSCFADWAAERTSQPRFVVEAALAHKIPDDTERAYTRSQLVERRRPLMADWAAFCSSPILGEVVPLHAARVAAGANPARR